MSRPAAVMLAALAALLAVLLSAWMRQPDPGRPAGAVAAPHILLEPTVRHLNPGTNHLCYRNRSHAVVCWGNNTWDQISADPVVAIAPAQRVRLSRRFRMVSGGNGHTCGIDLDGRVWCWGDASMGQMGDGVSYTNTIVRPQRVPGMARAVRIASGYDGSCALIRDGSVYCWGVIGRSNSRLRSRQFRVLRTPQRMPVPEPAIHLSFRVHHGCAVGVSGAVYCWGFNANGALGDGSTVDRMAPVRVRRLGEPMVQVATGYMHTCGIGESGRVHCWGWNGQAQLGNGPERPFEDDFRPRPAPVPGLTGIVQLAVHGHTCALDDAGRVSCWGYNEFGGAGQDNRRHPAVTRPRRVSLPEPALEIAPNEWSTCALGRSLKIYCWGSNKTRLIGETDPVRPWVPVPVAAID